MREGFTVLDVRYEACLQCGGGFEIDMLPIGVPAKLAAEHLARRARYGICYHCEAAYIKATSGHVGNSKASDDAAKLVFEAWLREPGPGETEDAATRCRKLGIG